MRKLVLSMLLVVGLAGLAFAAAEWQENGTRVNKSEKLNFVGGPDVSGNGTVTDVDFSTMTGNQSITGDVTVVGGIVTDGTIYTAKITSDGAVYPGTATLDPCPTLGPGYIFIGKGGMPCFCNAAGVDLSLYDGTTACW